MSWPFVRLKATPSRTKKTLYSSSYKTSTFKDHSRPLPRKFNTNLSLETTLGALKNCFISGVLEDQSHCLGQAKPIIYEDRSHRRFHRGSHRRNHRRNHRCSRCQSQSIRHCSHKCYWNRIRYCRSGNCISTRHSVEWFHRRPLGYQGHDRPEDRHRNHHCYPYHRCRPFHRSGLRLPWVVVARLKMARTIQGYQRAYLDSQHAKYTRHNCHLNKPEVLRRTQESNPRVSN